MGESRTDAALNVVQISGQAWASTVHKAAESLAQEPDADLSAYQASIQALAVRQLDTATVQAVDAELGRAGIVDQSGAINPQWVLAVWISAFAPVKIAAVVQSHELSVHTELGLAGGRGVGVSYDRRIRHSTDGVDVTEVRNAVEISFFSEENAWAAVKRRLPDVTGLPTPSAATPDETVANARYTIHLEVAAHLEGARSSQVDAWPGHVSRDIWTLTERLNSVRTSTAHGGLALTEVPAGDIGREFAWRLLGAREYLASAAEQAA